MEPQEIYCYDNKKDKKCSIKSRLGIVAIILLASFTLVLGFIIGAAISEAVLAALPAVIVLAVILALLFVLTLILSICKKEKGY